MFSLLCLTHRPHRMASYNSDPWVKITAIISLNSLQPSTPQKMIALNISGLRLLLLLHGFHAFFYVDCSFQLFLVLHQSNLLFFGVLRRFCPFLGQVARRCHRRQITVGLNMPPPRAFDSCVAELGGLVWMASGPPSLVGSRFFI